MGTEEGEPEIRIAVFAPLEACVHGRVPARWLLLLFGHDWTSGSRYSM